jgi:hypothetical protein
MRHGGDQQQVELRGWTRCVFGFLAITILAATPVLGLAVLRADLLPMQWSAANAGAEQLGAASPWTFDGPSAAAERSQLARRETDRAASLEVAGAQDAVVLTDWHYTLKTVVSQSK